MGVVTMWAWFTANSIWILIVSGIVIVLFLSIGERIRDKVVGAVSEERSERVRRNITAVFWTIEGIALAIVALAFAAITLSRSGVYAAITPETIQKWFLEHVTSILIIIVVGIMLWLALKKFLPPLLKRVMVKPKRGESREGMKRRADTLLSVFMGLGKVLIILLVIFMVLSELQINIGPILAGLGIVGIAVGFGAQYLIRDLIAGVFILLENQYRVGDVAKVADVWGLVEEVNLRKTVLRDLDGGVHHVPNGEIRVASNYTRHFARVNFNIPVAYGTDLDHAFRVINRVGQELADDEKWGPFIRTVPQVLRVDNFGDSGIDIKILGDVKPLEQWKVMGELRYRLKKAFDTEGIEIPWPHTKVYFGNAMPKSETEER
ncbi:mechanosensitive ion channel family protein [Chloroflexota bacterium]